MKKLTMIAALFTLFGCGEYKKGHFMSLYTGKYKAEYLINKKTNQQIDLRTDVKALYFSLLAQNLLIESPSETARKFDKKVNYDLTDRSTKIKLEDRDFYYNLVDSLTQKVYSLKVRNVSTDINKPRQLEISNLIEGKYDVAKDTLVYKCVKID